MPIKASTDQRRQQRYVSPNEAAQVFGVHGRTIRNMIARGQIRGYRLGPKLIRVDLAEIEESLRIIPSAKHAA